MRLERGEDIPTALAGFVAKKRMKSGFVVGLGAADKVVLGHFSLKTKKYRKRTFSGDYELASITGNISWDGETPICHLHAVITGPNMVAYGGHLFSAEVGATCELSILPAAKKLTRKLDPYTGLKLLALSAWA